MNRILITVEGGVVQAVFANWPASPKELRWDVLDFDVDEVDDDYANEVIEIGIATRAKDGALVVNDKYFPYLVA